MKVAGGILGAVLGLVVGALLVEVIFPNNQSWPDVVPFALAVSGYLVGSALGRRMAARQTASRS